MYLLVLLEEAGRVSLASPAIMVVMLGRLLTLVLGKCVRLQELGSAIRARMALHLRGILNIVPRGGVLLYLLLELLCFGVIVQSISHILTTLALKFTIGQLEGFLVDLRLILVASVMLAPIGEGTFSFIRFKHEYVFLREGKRVIQATDSINELFTIQCLAELLHLHKERAQHLK